MISHPKTEYDDDPGFDDQPYCDRCSNTSYIDCHCGGDLCVCEYQGEKPCRKCNRGEF